MQTLTLTIPPYRLLYMFGQSEMRMTSALGRWDARREDEVIEALRRDALEFLIVQLGMEALDSRVSPLAEELAIEYFNDRISKIKKQGWPPR